MNTAADIPILIISENSSSSERRVTLSWSISHLKARLEPITGIPASCQKLSLRIASQAPQPIEAHDEDTTQLSNWPLHTYAEIHVSNLRMPPASTSLQVLVPQSDQHSFRQYCPVAHAWYATPARLHGQLPQPLFQVGCTGISILRISFSFSQLYLHVSK